MENRLFEVRCPHCDALLSIEIGKEETVQTQCPHCRTLFLVESGDDQTPSAANPSVPEECDEEPVSATEDAELPTEIFGLSARMLIVVLAAVVFALLVLLLIVVQQSNRPKAVTSSQTEKSSEGADLDEITEDENRFPVSEEPILNGKDESDDEDESEESTETEIPGEIPPLESSFPEFLFPDSPINEPPVADETSAAESGDEELSLPEPVDAGLSCEEDFHTGESTPPAHSNSTENVQVSESDAGSTDSSQDQPKDDFDVDMYSRGEDQLLLHSSIESAEPIDIEKRLSMPIREIRLANAGLSDFLRLFYQLTGVPVELDWVSFASPVTMWEKRTPYSATDLTCKEYLQDFSASFELKVLPQEDRIHLAPAQEQNESMTVLLDCTDLLNGSSEDGKKRPDTDETPDPIFPETLTVSVLESALRDLVLDHHFLVDENEKVPELVWDGSVLKLTANRRIVEKAKIFLDRLRSLRHLPPKDTAEAELLIPENLCWDYRLSVPMDLCLLRPTPLSEVLNLLKKDRGVDFFFDYSNIPGGGTALDTPVKLIATEQPLEQILSELFAPLRLEWVVLTENLLAVTSPDRGELFDAEIHFYAAPDEEVLIERVIELVRQVKENVAPSTWSSEGGGKIWIDPVSRSFLIRQTLQNQRRIRRFMQHGLVGKENS